MTDFDQAYTCPDCDGDCAARRPVWVTLGSDSLDVGRVDYDAPDDGIRVCEDCGHIHTDTADLDSRIREVEEQIFELQVRLAELVRLQLDALTEEPAQ